VEEVEARACVPRLQTFRWDSVLQAMSAERSKPDGCASTQGSYPPGGGRRSALRIRRLDAAIRLRRQCTTSSEVGVLISHRSERCSGF
jgi:hypothetical protein